MGSGDSLHAWRQRLILFTRHLHSVRALKLCTWYSKYTCHHTNKYLTRTNICMVQGVVHTLAISRWSGFAWSENDIAKRNQTWQCTCAYVYTHTHAPPHTHMFFLNASTHAKSSLLLLTVPSLLNANAHLAGPSRRPIPLSVKASLASVFRCVFRKLRSVSCDNGSRTESTDPCTKTQDNILYKCLTQRCTRPIKICGYHIVFLEM